MTPPAAKDLVAAAETLSLAAVPEATVHLAALVGPALDVPDRDDVPLRVVYTLPASAYVGLNSFWDETEEVVTHEGFILDVVAFELAKVARLLLKGHRPTLEWLRDSPHHVVSRPIGQALCALASSRSQRLAAGETTPLAATEFADLNQLVVAGRLGMDTST